LALLHFHQALLVPPQALHHRVQQILFHLESQALVQEVVEVVVVELV
jgi:hypothetical protein